MLLLERGDSEINPRDLSSTAPLELGVQYGHVGIVGLLKAAQTQHSGSTGAEPSTSVGY
ncbi:hypothetical protein L873DRAFT_1820981 [Choiromyces venosus 120613-1]|uniref:Ankyrin n=1 Tax=Choiromyces venosus 120613-1 TaxID=1336337 RepID=A0A3N4J1R8_9PEZI|nr:hypothetical protein L873DRAFT_1820981 [Choiromyces venosus 120613-1]